MLRMKSFSNNPIRTGNRYGGCNDNLKDNLEPICFQEDESAAIESIESGLYVTWIPDPQHVKILNRNVDGSHNSTELYEYKYGNVAHDVIGGNSVGQCCRVNNKSACLCGHSLKQHLPNIRIPKRDKGGYIQPPKCSQCIRCSGFRYAPFHPAECGQYWLVGRNNFDMNEWRIRVQKQPCEYACIGCDVSVANHITLFETVADRAARNAAIGDMYRPLSDKPKLREAVLRKCRVSHP